MSARIERGLFRLWVVVGGLWIVAIIAITLVTIPLDWPGVLESNPDAGQDHSLRNAHLTTGLELALIPPVLVLVIGAGFVWAVRGFRE